ncbi:glycosyltransferase family 4 protein [Candidatus Peregrinibacteria bacterium]|nr:glycosyltransferase family 4 protein [Candidatus Peregrinibacteria bacterium]
MKTVGIDCRFGSLHAGLGRYTREVVTELLKRDDGLSYVLFVRSPRELWLKDLPKKGVIVTANFPHYSIQEQLFFPEILKRAAIDLLYSPHFNVPLRCAVPFVITVHDLILHRYPNEAGLFKRLGYQWVMRSAVQKARSIIAVSRFTAGELESIYGGVARLKASVIGEGVRMSEPTPDVKTKFHLGKPFFLYIGNAKQHKNVQTLIDAFARLPSNDRELVLVTHGKEVNRLRLAPGVRMFRAVSDRDLAALYIEATAFITASLYEGYCLPVVEAQSIGCPVIASKRGAILEVAAESAILIEPTAEAFAAAMRGDIPRKSAVRSPSWAQAAEQIARVLQAV